MTRILFVCLGNICRSPTAETVFRDLATKAELDVEIDSAGTENWHNGKQPYAPMQDAARPRGYKMSNLSARQVTPGDFHDFDLIIAMDAQNIEDLKQIAPDDATARLALFTDYAPKTGATAVPDPYYTRDFDGALDLIEACGQGLTSYLQSGSTG